MKTLYVHIGMPKTGTTALQQFLAKNRQALFDHGYIFREMPFHDYSKHLKDIPKRRNGYFLHGVLEGDPGYDPKSNRQRFEEGTKLIARWFEEKDNVILTDEVLWKRIMESDWVRDLKTAADRDGYRTRIIVYLRNQADYADSLYREHVRRHQITETWEEFRQRILPNLFYMQRLSKLEESFGAENVLVRVYDMKEIGKNGGTLYGDFAAAIALDWTADLKIPAQLRHESDSRESTEVRRILNRLVAEAAPEEKKERNRQIDALFSEENVLPEGGKGYSYFSAEEWSSFMQQFHDENSRITRDFTDRDFLFSEDPGNISKWEPKGEKLLEDAVLYLGYAALAQKTGQETEKKGSLFQRILRKGNRS